MTVAGNAIDVWLGAGGVGKTTLAAASAIRAALAGERVVVLTIDPARRLGDALGLDRGDDAGLGRGSTLGNTPALVEGPWPGELWAAMLDPAATLAALIRAEADHDQAERLLNNRLFAAITTSLGGTSEYMAAERLRQLAGDDRFDRVVLDTPPSRHAVDFLDGPTRLADFVENRFYRAVLSPRRGLLRPITEAARLVVRLTGRVVGSDLVDDVVTMFGDLSGLDQGFRRRATEAAALLADERCRYMVVSAPRTEPAFEAAWIVDNLTARHHPLDAIVVNRMAVHGRRYPNEHRDDDGDDVEPDGPLALNLAQLRSLASQQLAVVDAQLRPLAGGRPIVEVFERDDPPRSIDDLVILSEDLAPLDPVDR